MPYWAGVVLVGAVITLNVALGGMKGITLVQAFQYWVKMFAISVPIFVLMAVFGFYNGQRRRQRARRGETGRAGASTRSSASRSSKRRRRTPRGSRPSARSRPRPSTPPPPRFPPNSARPTSRNTRSPIRCSTPTRSSSRSSAARPACRTFSCASTRIPTASRPSAPRCG